jgi:hypothetical protein
MAAAFLKTLKKHEILSLIFLKATKLYFRRMNNQLMTRILKTRYCETETGDETLVDYLRYGKIFAAGKIGTAEVLGLEYHDRKIRWPIAGLGWSRAAQRLANNAGFFPAEENAFRNWDQIMRNAISDLDFICLWQKDPFLQEYERNLVDQLAPKARRVKMNSLGKSLLPLLVGQKILVISPFVRTMEDQLSKLEAIHDSEKSKRIDWDGLASQIQFLRCPFQWHLEPSPFSSWENGLNILTEMALSKKFEIALIGAGAWSIPLSAAIKKGGRSAIHTGGETQLFFGIRGKRWDSYGIYNSSWTSCLPEEAPMGKNKIDSGCYW